MAAVREFLPESSIDEVEDQSGGTVSDATRIQAVALALFAGVIGVTTLIFLGLAFVREAALGHHDSLALHALGMTRRHRDLGTGIPLALSGPRRRAVADGVGIALSPAFPFGLAGRAEPHRGLDVDLVVVAAGTCLLLLVTIVHRRASPPGSRNARRGHPAGDASGPCHCRCRCSPTSACASSSTPVGATGPSPSARWWSRRPSA